jgi:hypothetical protein
VVGEELMGGAGGGGVCTLSGGNAQNTSISSKMFLFPSHIDRGFSGR